MAVRAVIWDVSGTQLQLGADGAELAGPAHPGIAAALARLTAAGVLNVAAGNHGHRLLDHFLTNAGLRHDLIVGRDDVGKNKGSPEWIDHVCTQLGLRPHELFYVGDSKGDMITASWRGVLYAHAAWSVPRGDYGLTAPAPGWVPAVVQHIFRKARPWFWTLQRQDARGRPVHAMALLDTYGAGDSAIQDALVRLLKSGLDRPVGPMAMAEFVLLHLLSSVYGSRLFGETDWWTTYPGHAGSPHAIMGDFLDVASKLFRKQYRRDLLIRHTAAQKSQPSFVSGHYPRAIRNQATTLNVNAKYRRAVADKRILVLDNFLTRGYSTEHARNLLLAAGAKAVVVACVAKYNAPLHLVTAPDEPWDAFGRTPPDPKKYRWEEDWGTRDNDSLGEFQASYQAILAESW